MSSPFGPNAPRRDFFPPQPGQHTSLLPPSAAGSTTSLASTQPMLRSSTVSHTSSIADKFSLAADPATWGAELEQQDPDDHLHTPDPKRDMRVDNGGTIFTCRGFANLGFLLFLLLGMLTLFAGFPIISHFMAGSQSKNGGFNLGGINGSGQVPEITGFFGLIDPDTPADVRTKKGYTNDDEMELIFSDEFNVDGRTFYPGDDPYWEAVDLHYWQTNNMEWYDPVAVTTANGSMVITLDNTPNHGLDYTGGMAQTWNKFCFTGGLVEAAITLPGTNDILGLWPAVWAMGNLGRAGFGASLDGMWPYTYDACDVGTLANQTQNGRPIAATENGDPSHDGALSYLPGQRLSRCTCPGETHPGPVHSDGTYVGRAAPEIDIFEATVSNGVGFVSQSGQWAPFNEEYIWNNSTDNFIIYDKKVSSYNTYLGGAYQQATSVISETNQDCYYDGPDPCFAIYGFEYVPGFDNAYITWINDGKAAWTIMADGMRADTGVEISARPVPQEPMYLLANLGMSPNFGYVDVEHLTFPTAMLIDYIRVYQRSDSINIGCDPADFPTAAYIAQFQESYTNSNLTTWVDDYGQVNPKNSLVDQC